MTIINNLSSYKWYNIININKKIFYAINLKNIFFLNNKILYNYNIIKFL